MNKILYEIPHVILLKTIEGFQLIMEDTELFDTFEDLLVEKYNIENFNHTSVFKNGITFYTIHFSKDVKDDDLLNAVKSIPEKEVERIYKLNNPSD